MARVTTGIACLSGVLAVALTIAAIVTNRVAFASLAFLAWFLTAAALFVLLVVLALRGDAEGGLPLGYFGSSSLGRRDDTDR